MSGDQQEFYHATELAGIAKTGPIAICIRTKLSQVTN
jgi:hypothetical protein